MFNNSMAYIEMTLSNSHDNHQFYIDADDMKELMDSAYEVVSNTFDKIEKFDITSFNSNVINIDHFSTLIGMRFNNA
ncbi:MAG: hypothetical protein PHW18_11630 [Sulfuricurvum sp.]|uniref:hypothetical protein n=1 Tax=Sulfuricurvum sp. TaxID=2025608 RepID=UPI00263530B4|nr:hypothetical protein [Sulfuricurvum sp.]MDD2830214.1 hypothetical protein [Sulfuricurvum sp.]MDD4950016.1 hypothetical protein [Sulfuricurvum sp.]